MVNGWVLDLAISALLCSALLCLLCFCSVSAARYAMLSLVLLVSGFPLVRLSIHSSWIGRKGGVFEELDRDVSEKEKNVWWS